MISKEEIEDVIFLLGYQDGLTDEGTLYEILIQQQAKLKVTTDALEKARQLLMWHVGGDDFKGYKHPDQAKHMREIEAVLDEVK